jgi:two-component system, NtrC family, response regulator AlgB
VYNEFIMEHSETAPYHMNILVVDDEANIRKTLALCLESWGHCVSAVGNGGDAVAEANRQVFDLAFLDLRLGTENGLDLIPTLLAAAPWLKIVVITAYASIETAVEAMRRGATDYIAKPFKPDQVALVTERVSRIRSLEMRLSNLQDDFRRLHPEITFQSRHPGMQRAIELARQVATSEAAVLLRGASGTGKSVLAKAIHNWSSRRDNPLAIISCPTLSAELLESELFGHVKGAFTGALRDNPGRIFACESGTLFLDEIADLPIAIQPKLLRFLQDREYERVGDQLTRRADVRIIAATNADLPRLVREGRFREDLYYRLDVFPIDIPSLSQRPDDVETLAVEMLTFFAIQNRKIIGGFTPEAMQALRSHTWPGNIRELRNVVERAAIIATEPQVGIACLPATLAPNRQAIQLGDPVPLDIITEQHVRRILTTHSSLQEAADILGIDQATLWRKRKQYGL